MSLNFISIPTEQTTAVTELILAGQSMVCLHFVRPRSTNPCFALALWAWVFGLLSFSSLIGAFVHGLLLKLDREYRIASGNPLPFADYVARFPNDEERLRCVLVESDTIASVSAISEPSGADQRTPRDSGTTWFFS